LKDTNGDVVTVSQMIEWLKSLPDQEAIVYVCRKVENRRGYESYDSVKDVHKGQIEVEKQKAKQAATLDEDSNMIKILGKNMHVSKYDYELGKYKTSICFHDFFNLIQIEANENAKIANLLRCCAKNLGNTSNSFDYIDLYIDPDDRIDFQISEKVFGIAFSIVKEKAIFVVLDVERKELYSVNVINPDMAHFIKYFHVTLNDFNKMCSESMTMFAESNSYRNWCKNNPSPSMLKEQQSKQLSKNYIKLCIALVVILPLIFSTLWI